MISPAMALSSASGWILKQPKKLQATLAALIAIGTVLGVHFFSGIGYLFIISEVIYSIAYLVLVYRLATKKNCSGLSLKTQEATAIFLLARLICCLTPEIGIQLHLCLDSVSLICTCWVIYMMRFKLQSKYTKELDNMPLYYLVVPCFALALLVNPNFCGMPWIPFITSVLWAFYSYMDAVSVLPQLRLIQNAKMVEPFTSHYVFALGLSRFFGFVHWGFQVYDISWRSILMHGRSMVMWFPIYLIVELVQTFILADFCYYYTKSVMLGFKMNLPLPV